MESVIRLELVFPCDLAEGTRNEFCSDSVVAVNPKTRPSGSKWSLVDTHLKNTELDVISLPSSRLRLRSPRLRLRSPQKARGVCQIESEIND